MRSLTSGLVPSPGGGSGSGSGAPTDAQYLVSTANGDLTAERVATDTATVTWDFGTAAQAKANVPDGGITYAKIQDVSATDKVLGRSTAGAGDVEEIACTAAGRALLDDASASAQRTTLGVGTADSPEFAALNVGHASDTTLTRVSAGNLAVEGNALYRAGGTDVPIADGGTGQSTAMAAFDALSPLTTQGDLIYHDGSDNVRLAKGTALQVLRMNSGATAPEWASSVAQQTIVFASGDSGGFNPADSTPFYFGLFYVPTGDPTTTAPTQAGGIAVGMVAAGTIRSVYLTIVAGGTLATTETGTGAIRVNNGTDSVVFNNTLQWNSVTQAYAATGLSIALAAGDFFSFKITPPAWVTNPTVTFYGAEIVVSHP